MLLQATINRRNERGNCPRNGKHGKAGSGGGAAFYNKKAAIGEDVFHLVREKTNLRGLRAAAKGRDRSIQKYFCMLGKFLQILKKVVLSVAPIYDL